ncbi:hypothetical protein F5884DRAFT_39797 [Xylogone sp. PMI_703]|nr:hypothetical protein F5884DRAFT_39797 [Xylogone sp. PMI_703]
MDQLAPHVCIFCKQNKRKCDKKLPSCSHCRKVHRECQYDNDSSDITRIKRLRRKLAKLEQTIEDTPSDTPTSITGSRSPYSSLNVAGQSNLDINTNLLSSLTRNTDPFCYPQLRKSFIDATVMDEVSKVVGSFTEFMADAESYFDTVNANNSEKEVFQGHGNSFYASTCGVDPPGSLYPPGHPSTRKR